MPPVEQAATVYHNSAGALFSSWEKNRLQVIQQGAVDALVADYLRRFSEIAGPLINCAPILNWFELDARGSRLLGGDESDINTPAVAAALVGKRYVAQASDEISLEVGDMISVIDMAPPDESAWWRGKRGFEVGFFPCECVQLIGDAPEGQQGQRQGQQQQDRHRRAATLQPGQQPLLRRQGKLTAFFRSFIATRPSRRRLKQSGILRERVFGCDLGEHLINSGHDIPVVLKSCAEFIETHGIVDGIYRLSGVTSNIQRLRNTFDEERVADLSQPSVRQDIHSVSGLLKQYLRELPNPLLTYQLYDKFVWAVQSAEDQRLIRVRQVVQQLPPPHYRTLEYLIRHLSRVATHHRSTGMTAKNLAIVWAPNLVRNQELELGGVAALQGIGVQAVIVEYLIRSCELVFSDKLPAFPVESTTQPRPCKRSRPRSLALTSPSRLLSLEEAQARLGSPSKAEQNYIDVGGGPATLPSKYHTIITPPVKKSGSLRLGRSPIAWKSLFRGRSRQQSRTDRDISLASRTLTESDLRDGRVRTHGLRSVRSFESLVPPKGASQRSSLMLSSDASASGASGSSAPPHRPISRLDSYFDSPDSDSLGVSRTLPRNIRPESFRRSSTAAVAGAAAAAGVGAGAGAVQRPPSGGRLEEEAEYGPVERNEPDRGPGPAEQPAVPGEPRESSGPAPDQGGVGETASASAATSRDVPPIPTDSSAGGPAALPGGALVTPLRETSESILDSEISTHGSESGAVAPPAPTPDSHCTPADEDATGKDLSELVDEEATLDRLRSPVPVALELLDRRLNPADAYENIEDDRRPLAQPSVDQEYQNVGTEAAAAAAAATTTAGTADVGESDDISDAADEADAEAYEPIVFSGSSGDAETIETSEACETETFENEAYEHRAFDSQTYENETFAHVADLPYENIGEPEEQDDRWVYEDITPAPTPVETAEDRVYEPVCVARADDDVYEQVREFRRTLKEVNSIVEVGDDKRDVPTVKASPESPQASEESCEEAAQPEESRESPSEDQPEMPELGDALQQHVDESQEHVAESQEVLAVKKSPDGAPPSPAAPRELQPIEARAATPPAEPEPQMVLFLQAVEGIREASPMEAEVSEGNISPVSVEPSTSVAVEVAASAAETEPLTRPLNPEPLTPVDSAGSPEPAPVDTAEQSPTEAEEASAEVITDGQYDVSEPSMAEVELEREDGKAEASAGEEGADVSAVSPTEPPQELESTEDDAVVENQGDILTKDGDVDDMVDSEVASATENTEAAPSYKASNNTPQGRLSARSPAEGPEEAEMRPAAPAAAESGPLRSVREWRRPPIARSQTLPASATADAEEAGVPPSPTASQSSHHGQSGNTWPVRRPTEFTTAAVARILPLPDPAPDPRASSFKSSTADRPDSSDSTLSCKSAPAGQRAASGDGSALPPPGNAPTSSGVNRRSSDLSASNSDLRRPSLRRASVRQLLSRFEASSGGDIAVQDDPSESEPKLTERAVGSVHEQTSPGGYALATRSLPRPATRRRAGSPDRKRSLPAAECRPASPRPVRRHLSFQTVVAPEVRVAGVSGHSFRRTSCEEEVLKESAVGRDTVRGGVRDGSEKRLSGFERRASQRSTASCDVTSSSLEREKRKRPDSLPVLSRPNQDINTTAEKSNGSTCSAEASESSSSAHIPAGTPDAATAVAVADATSRERIERYKEERRTLLRERFNAESFLRRPPGQTRDRASSSGRSPSPPSSPADPAPTRPLRRADSLRSPLSAPATAPAPITVNTAPTATATASVPTAAAAVPTVTAGTKSSTTKPRTSDRSPTRRANSLRTTLSVPRPAAVPAASAGTGSIAPTAGPDRPAAGEAAVPGPVAGWGRRSAPVARRLPPAAVTRHQSAPEVSKVQQTPEVTKIQQAPEVGKIRHMAARFESGAGGSHRSSPVPTL